MHHHNYLDWSRALTGRLSEVDLTKTSFAARLKPMASRLNQELKEGKLPFLNLPFKDALEKDLANIQGWLKNFKHMLVLGIGGSALGARAIQKAFAPAQDRPEHNGKCLWIADNVDSESLEALFNSLPPNDTVVVVISKSGGTIETLGQYFLVKQWLEKKIKTQWKDHVLMITDQNKGFLREEATKHTIKTLPVPDNLGGRYSALSAVGLVPALFLGVDCHALLKGACATASAFVNAINSDQDMAHALEKHAAWKLAIWNNVLMEKGYNQIIFFSYIPAWACFGNWFTQLWAESLGKEGKGSMPVPAVGVTDQHSTQQMFLDGPKDKACLFLSYNKEPSGLIFPQDLPEEWSYLRGRPFGVLLEAETLGTRMALNKSEVPVVNMVMGSDSEYSAGSLMMLLEITTVLTGWLLDINPIDQPAVELGKRLANARLGATGYTEEKEDLANFLAVKPLNHNF
ncbi:glucose-6-phosphate isomerase [Desulfovibrio litoralis]|uniref:Glucose-6-phosphate isomerase n=1 Tax=Desulfovibrio litoralis DSM 11393 TaxID=1121455 RepID=A0A1M7T411_9BACT|nr:glucose-6-phosphate isomerase [Desulfovibrio litoralis]SHN65458.1 glucose-6-phosphate isomerase [Desulfovibrio litoralis DSM 11393]